MRSLSRTLIASFAGIALLLALMILFHLGGISWQFAQLQVHSLVGR